SACPPSSVERRASVKTRAPAGQRPVPARVRGFLPATRICPDGAALDPRATLVARAAQRGDDDPSSAPELGESRSKTGSAPTNQAPSGEGNIMALVPDALAFQQRLEGFPVRTCQAGETLLSAGTATGRLLILKSGAVEVVKDEYSSLKSRRPARCSGSWLSSWISAIPPMCALRSHP